MRVSYASVPAPGLANEDLVIAGAQWVAVLDGATAPVGVDSGCVHDVAWLVRRLGAQLSVVLLDEPVLPLTDVLERAISAVRLAHGPRCDLDNPDSPSATVTMLRSGKDAVDYLVLCDSPLILDINGNVRAVLDERIAHLPSYTLDGVRAARNSPGGFWVASTDPQAAHEAVRGSVEPQSLVRAALLSDGASRFVERFQLGDWADLLTVLDTLGPAELIRLVRAAETADITARRGKLHDDATAVLLTFA